MWGKATRAALPLGALLLVVVVVGAAGAIQVGERRDLPAGAGSSFGQIGTFAVADGSGNEVVFDGMVDEAVVDSTWVYDGSTWSHPCGDGTGTPCGPAARQSYGMGEVGGSVFVFGGLTTNYGDPAGTVLADTWAFNGTTWDEVCSTCAPGARVAPAMAGDGTRAVMFGGFGPGPLSDTWQFDGTTWTQLCGGAMPACGPPDLVAATMLWDGSQFVLFGGTPDFATPSADTWVLSGSSWTKVCGSGMAPCGPVGRAIAPAASLAGGGALMAGGLLLDGTSPVGGASDLWRWDGSAWSEESVPWDTDPIDFDSGSFPACGPVFAVLATEGSGARISGMFTQGSGGPSATFTSFLLADSVSAPLDRAAICPSEAPPPTTPTTPTGTAPPAASPGDGSGAGPGGSGDPARTSLPATGPATDDVVWLGFALVVGGGGFVSAARHRDPRRSRARRH